MGILVLYSFFVYISNLQLIEMQVHAFYVSHDISYWPHSSFKKLSLYMLGLVIVELLVLSTWVEDTIMIFILHVYFFLSSCYFFSLNVFQV